MKTKSIKKNYIYNALYQVFLLIVPLIVTPYISRVLLPDGIGQYSFSFSLISYFTIFAALGFGSYAQREIAKHQGNKDKQSSVFWEIILCRLISVALSLGLNIILCFTNSYGDYTSLMWIFSINIIATGLDVAFLFQGNEEFGKLVSINLLIKIVSIACIFIFVKTANDLWLYTVINVSMLLVSNLVMWLYLPKVLTKVKMKSIKPLRHLVGSLKLFIPTVAVSIYTILDKTLIGVLVPGTYTEIVDGIEVIKKFSDLENGFYEQSEKIVKMAMTIITCLGTVMIPRNSSEIAQGNLEKVKESIYTTSKFVWMIGIPMAFGIIAISSNAIPWFLGEEYSKSILIICILSLLVLFIGFSNVFGVQYLLPIGRDTKYSIALITGAVVNLLLNVILIPFYWSIGAAIASVIAELSVTCLMAFFLRKELNIKRILLSSWKYVVSGVVMFGVCLLISYYLESSIINTIVIAGSGVATYVIMLLILRESMLYTILRKIGHKLKRGEKNDV